MLQRISIDPAVCFGKPVNRETRIWVSVIADYLPEGIAESELLAAYPPFNPGVFVLDCCMRPRHEAQTG